ncbi:MAG: HD domain-containing protein [Ruminococcaceae bacterium]|nr:HD domain-containing protein [Oscillospiraceae bacterium]
MNFVNTPTPDILEGFCLIKSLEKKTTAKGLTYLDLILSDSSGEIVAKFWDYKENMHSHFEANMLVKVRGRMNEYNGDVQFRVERIRECTEADGVRIEDFVPSANYTGEEMLRNIYEIIETFDDAQIKKLVKAVLAKYEEKLVYWPAAFKLHHAMRGGLLYHTLSIIRMAECVCKIYTSLDRSLLLGGAILHDIAKIDEFEVSSTGMATGYSVEGTLVGHLVKGAMIVRETAKEIGTDEDTAVLLEHMLISHHGIPEYGAAVRPLFVEAEVLSQLDTLDATIYEFNDALLNVKPGDFSSRQWALDNRKLYNHGRREISTDVNLD